MHTLIPPLLATFAVVVVYGILARIYTEFKEFNQYVN